MTRVVLIRHGESQCNANGLVGGHDGCTGLTDKGRKQALALRNRLSETGELESADALYSSLLERAAETARIIAPAVGGGSLQLVESCSLCELHVGEGDGLEWTKFTELYGEPSWKDDPHSPISPGGESWTEFVKRASGGIAELANKHGGGLVVVACHGGVIEASMISFLPLQSHIRPWGLPTAYTSLTEWEYEESG
jgi:probable phosphoglycerate mutase